MNSFLKIACATAMLVAGTTAFAADNGTSQGAGDHGGVTTLQDPNAAMDKTDPGTTGAIMNNDKTIDNIKKCGAAGVDTNGNCMLQPNNGG